MALIKNIQTEYGIEAGYWKISRISIDTIKKEISFTLNLYIDKEHQQKELGEMVFASAILTQEEFKPQYDKYFRKDEGENYKDIYTACYMYAKDNMEFFKDAEDDKEEMLKEAAQ